MLVNMCYPVAVNRKLASLWGYLGRNFISLTGTCLLVNKKIGVANEREREPVWSE